MASQIMLIMLVLRTIAMTAKLSHRRPRGLYGTEQTAFEGHTATSTRAHALSS